MGQAKIKNSLCKLCFAVKFNKLEGGGDDRKRPAHIVRIYMICSQ